MQADVHRAKRVPERVVRPVRDRGSVNHPRNPLLADVLDSTLRADAVILFEPRPKIVRQSSHNPIVSRFCAWYPFASVDHPARQRDPLALKIYPFPSPTLSLGCPNPGKELQGNHGAFVRVRGL